MQPNPNPNPNPKQFYEDVMQHGHPHSYDDAILESGNRNAKRGKRILFWGGSNELDPTIDPETNLPVVDEHGKRKRAKVSQERPTGLLDPTTGDAICKTTIRPINASVEVQHLENTRLRQRFECARPLHEKSQRRKASEHIKSDVYMAQCAAVVESLDKLGTVTAAAVVTDDATA